MKYKLLLAMYKVLADWVPRALGGRSLRSFFAAMMFRSCGSGLVLEKNNTPHRNAVVGNNVQIGASCRFMIGGQITLEDDVLLAPEVVFVDTNHKMSLLDIPIHRQGSEAPKPIVIRQGAWIGIRAIILPGVEVGANSVVAAGAVVVSDVPEFAIVGGNPAKFIKSRNPGCILVEGPK